MKQMFVGLLILVLVAVATIVVTNRNAAYPSGEIAVSAYSDKDRSQRSLSIVTWNLGYGGLGKDSDFVADGGTHYFPPSSNSVDANLLGISRRLSEMPADVYFFQEVSVANPLNYGRDVLQTIRRQLPNYSYVFDPELKTHLVPRPLKLIHGGSTFSRYHIGAAWRQNIVSEEEYYFGMLRRNYRLLVTRLPIDGSDKEWVLINIHLAAFDGGSKVRRRQLEAVLSYAIAQYDKGDHVIVGGDWNLEFVKSPFPHKTAAKYLFWIHPFPHELVPKGWNLAFDESVPSVRTVHKPYEPGSNYVAIIDGYLSSPNVVVEDVAALETAFENTDHQPVLARFTAHQ